MKRILLSIITITAINFGANAQNVNIPDANFKAYLVGNTAINTNADTEIQVGEASAFNSMMFCEALSINDLTGIEAFTAITQLHCSGNSLTSLDVTQNTNITQLTCNWNQLSGLDVTQNTLLTMLDCANNQVTSLDIANNTALTILDCSNNQVTSLSIVNNLAIENVNGQNNSITTFTKGANNSLVYLYLANNGINTIDISDLPALYVASIMSNSLTSIDVTNCDNLGELNVENNFLTSLDLSATLSLESLICNDNNLSSIDVSFLPYFVELLCENNILTSVDIQNGNNSAIATNYFKSTGNPDLTCIQVDDAAYSTTNWTNIDAGASFSEDCNGGIGVEEIESQRINLYPNPASSIITIETDDEIELILIFDLFGAQVQQETTASFSIEGLSSGIYFANVQTSAGIARVRFVKD